VPARRGVITTFMVWSVAAALAAVPTTAFAQATGAPEPRLRQQQDQLDKLRKERSDLESKMVVLQRSARTLTDEANNLEAQRKATARLVTALDQQQESINREVIKAGSGLVKTESELLSKRSALQRRMVEIYKRGRLSDVEAMLSAQSFAGLVARYKYLHELALHDRGLVRRVEGLRDQLESQRLVLVRLQDEVARNRAEKAREVRRLTDLESRRQRNLTTVQRSAAQTRARLAQLARDESRVAGVIASLDWPVDGAVLYRFGRVINSNNTTTRWNGMGIGAPVGTAVKSIAAGEVVLADNVGTYGPTVILQHGGGDYSVYGSLDRITVRKGQQIPKGQTVGTVGATDPDLPSHLHFEIRPKGRSVDPLVWLRGQR
jgi:septal ring factor EnvC (AmiA/AmiB activator)